MTGESILQIKQRIAPFIAKRVEDIIESTPIDKSTLPGSIILHRMYADIESLGFKVTDYSSIRTFGELITILDTDNKPSRSQADSHLNKSNNADIRLVARNEGIGIDIEHISHLPIENDYWESAFYLKTFSRKEIAYCLSSINPLQSFLGKYAAKEAIIKADNRYASTPLNQIEILNDENGKPFFEKFDISISHVSDLAVSVAVQFPENKVDSTPVFTISKDNNIDLEKLFKQNQKIKLYFNISLFIMLSILLINLLYFLKIF